MINLPNTFKENKFMQGTSALPLLPLRDMVVFPHMIAPLFVGRVKSIAALTEAMDRDKKIFLTTQKDPNIENPTEHDLSTTGTIGNIIQLLRLPDKTIKVLIEGKTRAKILNFISDKNFLSVDFEIIYEESLPAPKEEALHRTLNKSFEEYTKINKKIGKDVLAGIQKADNLSQLADTIITLFPFKLQDMQLLLNTDKIDKRVHTLIKFIQTETEIFGIEQKIKTRIKSQMEKTQKQYYLNEQIRAIKKEMGTADTGQDELDELEKNIKRKKMSKEALKKVKNEFKKLKLMTPMSAEAAVVRNYIEWIISIPWFEKSKVQKDLDKAERILNEDHYGLEKPKERILEYLAVQSLTKKIKGPILCLVGPPGVGKTSLAKSVAHASGRKFVRLSLGGVRDEAEIRGHRRTYVGAMPGKIVQSMKKANVNNPVFCLDEIDKMSMDFRGDPSAALLEVLDPEQNNSFNDHYLDIDYDLSDILFITTANTLPNIPLPLQDRMEVIKLSGYTEHDKFNIANNFLIPKQIKTNGLKDYKISFYKKAVYKIIQKHTREAGVRNLEREIASICRKIAKKVIKSKKENQTYIITPKAVTDYLGHDKFRHGEIENKDLIGTVTGLAWTSVGGELLLIESVLMPGKGDLIITGQLGDVMKESAKAAVSYVRSKSELLKIDKDFYKKYDIHIHVPEGAIPKDGPSAGITMCSSIVSSLTKQSVYKNLAMTGEITLRGRVLPIGGLRDKLLAAHRAGITQVIIPSENKKDLEEIPPDILKQIEIIPVDHIDDVLNRAFVEKGQIFTSDS